MKKLFVLLAAALLTFGAANNANAASRVQSDFAAIGLHTGYFAGLGVGLNLDFNAGNWRGRLMVDGGGFNDHLWLTPAVDFHYVLPIVAGLAVYPIVGVNGRLYTDKYEPFNLGLDLGAGVEYMFTPRFGIFAEGKYQYMLISREIHWAPYNGCFGFTFAL